MKDPIERQDAIDAANRADYTGLALEDVKKVTDEVVKEIKKLPSAQRWIPVSERLPENTRTVLTTFIEDGVAKVDTLNYFGKPLEWTDFRYVEELGRPKSYEVTAWMPLPEPWRGEEP